MGQDESRPNLVPLDRVEIMYAKDVLHSWQNPGVLFIIPPNKKWLQKAVNRHVVLVEIQDVLTGKTKTFEATERGIYKIPDF